MACTYFPGPLWTLDEIHALFSPEQDDIQTPILGYDFTTDTPRRRAWIAAARAAFRHLSALHVQQTERLALPRENDDATLESIIGSYWTRLVLEALVDAVERPPLIAVGD
ncbi:MAG: hypothetical protein V4813_13120 [Gemmatimonadota bacterium]